MTIYKNILMFQLVSFSSNLYFGLKSEIGKKIQIIGPNTTTINIAPNLVFGFGQKNNIIKPKTDHTPTHCGIDSTKLINHIFYPFWKRGRDSNPRLTGYEPVLLPLHHPAIFFISKLLFLWAYLIVLLPI